MPLDETSTEEVHDKLVKVLSSTSSLYLATSKPAGSEPWNAGAFYCELSPSRLTLVLETHGTTLRNLTANPQVAFVIAPEGAFAPFLQGKATGAVRDAAGKEDTIKRLREKEPAVEPLLAAPVEAVTLDVQQWRVTDLAAGWLPGKTLTPNDH